MTAIVGHDSRYRRYEVCIQCFIQKIHHLEYGEDLESYFCWMHFHALPILATVLRRPCHPVPPGPSGWWLPLWRRCFGLDGSTIVIGFVPKTWGFFLDPFQMAYKWGVTYSSLTGMIQATQTMDYPRANGCPLLLAFHCILRFGNFITHGEDWKLAVESWEESWRLTG